MDVEGRGQQKFAANENVRAVEVAFNIVRGNVVEMRNRLKWERIQSRWGKDLGQGMCPFIYGADGDNPRAILYVQKLFCNVIPLGQNRWKRDCLLVAVQGFLEKMTHTVLVRRVLSGISVGCSPCPWPRRKLSAHATKKKTQSR